jgi:hypothetical protein
MVVRRLYSGNVIINDYVVLAVKCRDIPMVVPRLYSGNVIVNDYLVPAIKCRDILCLYHCQNKDADDHWYICTFYSRNYVIIDYNIARIKMPDDHWYISTFNSRDYVIGC